MINTTQQPWLSLLIPVYNCRDYLEDCLAATVSQACEDIEILFYDDGSSDDSAALLQEIAARGIPGLKIILAEKNQGLSVARNEMLAEATGDYVWFLDSDDYLLPQALVSIREIVTQHRPDAIFFDYRMVDEKVDVDCEKPPNSRYVKAFGGVPRSLETDKNLLFQSLFSRRRFQAWARVLKRSAWQAGEAFPPGKYFEDLASVPYTLAGISTYYYQPQAMVAYRRRQSSIVRTPSLEKISDMLQGPLGVLDYWQARNIVLSNQSKFEFYKFCATNYVNATKMLRAAKISSSELSLSAVKAQFRVQLFQAFGFGIKRFIWEFVKRGELLSLYRTLRYFYSRE